MQALIPCGRRDPERVTSRRVERVVHRGEEGSRKEERAAEAQQAANRPKERIMLCKRLTPLFITAVPVAAPPVSGRADAPEKAAKMSQAFSVLHAVSQWSNTLSEMADKKAKSDLVKGYARTMATANADADAKLRAIAEKGG